MPSDGDSVVGSTQGEAVGAHADSSPHDPTTQVEEVGVRAVSPLASSESSFTWSGSDTEKEVLSAVFCYQIDTAAGALECYSLAIRKGDEYTAPPAEIVAKVSSGRHNVAAFRGSGANAPCAVVFVDGFRVIDALTIEVDGGWSTSANSGERGSYRVRLVDGDWTVIDETMLWIL